MSILNWDPEGSDYIEGSPPKPQFINERDRLAYVFETDLKEFLYSSPQVRAFYELIRDLPATNIDLIPIFVAYVKTTELNIKGYKEALLKERQNG